MPNCITRQYRVGRRLARERLSGLNGGDILHSTERNAWGIFGEGLDAALVAMTPNVMQSIDWQGFVVTPACYFDSISLAERDQRSYDLTA
jgi:hypothetical protein